MSLLRTRGISRDKRDNGGATELLRGAAIISLGGFLAKLLGAFYRLPLLNLLGAEGLGLYQMAFPLYALLLSLSASGIPLAVSKLVSESEARKEGVFASARVMLFLSGALFAFLMAIFSGYLSTIQGNTAAKYCYLCLSPSVLLVSLASSYRGYFQGRLQMTPTAVSQIIEQGVKLAFGLLIVKMLLPDVVLAAAGACFAVTVSEAAALVYLKIKKGKAKNLLPLAEKRPYFEVFALSSSLAVMSVVSSVSHFTDSFLIINILRGYTASATALFGLYSAVCSVVSLPVSLAGGVSVSIVPIISRSKALGNNAENKTALSYKFTLFVALPSALALFVFSDRVIPFLYGSLSSGETKSAITLLKLLAPTVVALSVLQNTNSVLIASGKTLVPLLGALSGAIVKIILEIILLTRENLNVYGAAISDNAADIVALAVNLVYIISSEKIGVMPFALSTGAAAALAVLNGYMLAYPFKGRAAFLITVVFTVALYAAWVYLIQGGSRERRKDNAERKRVSRSKGLSKVR